MPFTDSFAISIIYNVNTNIVITKFTIHILYPNDTIIAITDVNVIHINHSSNIGVSE
jgi:hypothetical protein